RATPRESVHHPEPATSHFKRGLCAVRADSLHARWVSGATFVRYPDPRDVHGSQFESCAITWTTPSVRCLRFAFGEWHDGRTASERALWYESWCTGDRLSAAARSLARLSRHAWRIWCSDAAEHVSVVASLSVAARQLQLS